MLMLRVVDAAEDRRGTLLPDGQARSIRDPTALYRITTLAGTGSLLSALA